MPSREKDYISSVTLDPNTIISSNPEEVHEWRIAIEDLLHDNRIRPARSEIEGPFALHLSIVQNYILFDLREPDTYEPIAAHYLSLTPFRELIRDYFRIRDSYLLALRAETNAQIEAVDMGRRGLHDEAAEKLQQRLANKIEMDHPSARRLFSLICAIQPYAQREDVGVSTLPTVLFVCSLNSIRSPIAAAIARTEFAGKLIARSAGAHSGRADPMVEEVMAPLGIDMSVHTPHRLDELVASHFDLVITLSPEANAAMKDNDIHADKIAHWNLPDPTAGEGNRTARLAAFTQLRDDLRKLITRELPGLMPQRFTT